MAETSSFLQAHAMRGVLRTDEPMAKHVSWRAGGRARVFFQPSDLEDLRAFLPTRPADEPILFVGLGSNLLVRDGGFAGTVVLTHHALTGIEMTGPMTFTAGAGVPSPHLARFVARHGGAGAEWLAGVPGTVGGALAMNAGCYGGETWNHVVNVQAIDRGGALKTRVPSEYEIGYRHMHLREGHEEWFVAATFAFHPGEEAQSMATIKSLLARRVASQPLNEPNAGSVFRNPVGDHAARLIEAAGLKGHTIGGAQVSTKHSNFIINTGKATAADIETLIDHVQATVLAASGIELVREVRIIGDRA
nr:UDP-N-acetylmuramate dehydrogenase [Usitatibacter palustris]